jgi:cytochrome P450
MASTAAPGPNGIPLIGSLLDFSSDPLAFLRLVADRYGDIASFRLPMGRIVLFNDPDAVRYILTDVRVFQRSGTYRALSAVLGLGLLTTDGPFHGGERRAIAPLFTRRESLRHADYVMRAGQRVCARLCHEKEVDVLAEMRHAALDVMFFALFGVEVGAQSSRIFDAIDELEKTFDNPLFLFLPQLFEYMPVGRAPRFRAARERLRSLLGTLIRETAEAPAASERIVSRMVCQSKDGEQAAHGESLLLDHALTFLLAGHDTTANTLSWAWYLIARHPEIEALLHEEWDTQLDGRTPAVKDLDGLRLTEMVIKETLRLYPQAWIQGRRSATSFSWSNYAFPAGTEVMVSAYVTHRDPRFFDRPDVFDPCRWKDADNRSQPGFSYFPFGAGVHRCIGEYLAKAETTLLLATIGQRWRFRQASSSPVLMRPSVTLKPQAGLRMIASERRPN